MSVLGDILNGYARSTRVVGSHLKKNGLMLGALGLTSLPKAAANLAGNRLFLPASLFENCDLKEDPKFRFNGQEYTMVHVSSFEGKNNLIEVGFLTANGNYLQEGDVNTQDFINTINSNFKSLVEKCSDPIAAATSALTTTVAPVVIGVVKETTNAITSGTASNTLLNSTAVVNATKPALQSPEDNQPWWIIGAAAGGVAALAASGYGIYRCLKKLYPNLFCEEYNVDEKEKKAGHNPEEELRENGFVDYTRPVQNVVPALSTAGAAHNQRRRGNVAYEYGDPRTVVDTHPNPDTAQPLLSEAQTAI